MTSKNRPPRSEFGLLPRVSERVTKQRVTNRLFSEGAGKMSVSGTIDYGSTDVEKRVLVAGLVHQTNTFVGGRTGLEDFEVRRGEEILRRIRGIEHLSDAPICGVFDLHANFTEAMARQSDGLIAYRESPHADAREAERHQGGGVQEVAGPRPAGEARGRGAQDPRADLSHRRGRAEWREDNHRGRRGWRIGDEGNDRRAA